MTDETFDVNEPIEDYEDHDEKEVKEKTAYDKALAWAGDHKAATIAGAVLATVGAALIGGKIFSKTETKTVVKEPDPTIMDKYDRIPVEEHSFVDYKYVLKPEYREDDDD